MTRAINRIVSLLSLRSQKQRSTLLFLGLLLLFLAHGTALLFRIQPAVSLWFPPSGVAIALTLWLGPIGALLTWIVSFIVAPLWGSDGWARLVSLTDAIEPLVAWFLFYRCFRGTLSFESLWNAIAFLISAPLFACGASALLGTLTLVAFEKMSLASLSTTIPHWWLGNALGTMVIAPTVLLLMSQLNRWHQLQGAEPAVSQPNPMLQNLRHRWLEIGLVLGSTVFFGLLTVKATQASIFATLQFSLLSTIPVFWAVARFGVVGSVTVASFSVVVTLLCYLWVYPYAIDLPAFPVNPELLYTHKLSLLLQCAIALLAGSAITERSAAIVALEIEKVKRAETEATAQLSEELLKLNHLLQETNQQLQASEERFRTSVENMLDSFGIYSAVRNEQGQIVDFRIEYLNHAACFNNQLSHEDQIGRGLCEVFPGHYESGLFEEYCQVVETGQPLIKDSLVYEDKFGQRYLVRAFDIRTAKLNDGLVITWRDVTELKQIERSLRQANQQFQLASEAVNSAIYDWDIRQNRIERTSGMERMFGYQPEEMETTSKWYLARIHPDDVQEVIDRLQATFIQGDRYDLEYRMRDRQGNYLHVADRGLLIRDEAGQVIRVVGSVMDISERARLETERQQIEQALKQSEERLRLALEAANLGMWHWETERDQLTWTDRCKALFGLPADADVSVDLFLSILHPEDQQRVQEFMQALTNGQVPAKEMEYRIILPDRTERWLHASGDVQYNADGKLISSTGVISDITARKQFEAALQASEARYRYLTEAMPQIVWMADATGAVTYWNQRWYDYSGMNEAESLGLAGVETVHPEDRDRTLQQWSNAIQAEATFDIEYRIRRNDGVYRWFISRAVPLQDSNGQIINWLGTITDIDDHKRIQEELRQSEERLSLALRSAQAGMWQWFRADNRTIWSDENYRLLGYEPGSILSNYDTWLAAVHPDDWQMAEQAINRALEEQSSLYFEYRVALPNSDERWLADIGQLTYDAEGTPNGMIGIQIDITQRKQVEIALQQSQERLNLAMEAAGMGSWEWEIQTGQVYWSPNLERLFGLEIGSFDGRYETMLAMIHPNDRSWVQQALHRAVHEQQDYNIEFRFIKPDGAICWAVGRGQVFYNAAGTPVRMAGIDLDISNRKLAEAALQKSEERLRMALNATEQGLYDLNLRTGEVIVSPEYARMLGYDPEEFYETNQSWRDRMHPDDVETAYRIYQEYVAGKRQEYQVEFRQRTKTGDWVWILSIGRIVAWDAAGNPLRMLGTHTNIGDRKQIEVERIRLLEREQAARQQAESASRMKDEFLAIVSHELRSPLNGILGWSRLLRTRTLDPNTVEKALASIERNAQAQTQLIEDLLDISRIIRGTVRLSLRPLNLIPIIQASLDTVRPTATAKSIDLDADLDLDVGLVSGDFDRLQQIIWNLLSNAVKFTPMGGQVEVRLGRSNAYAQIQVIDTGRGISAEFLPHVFDRFRQADATTTRTQGGLGLGLAIVRSLVELHGGTIWAESAGEGEGATFTVELPLLSGSHQQTNPNFIPAASDRSISLEQVRVLVVDDEVDTRDFMLVTLKQYGAIVTVAASAPEAFELFQQNPPDVLLSDIGMPEEDGYALIQRIRALPPEFGGRVPAAALTAYVRGDDRQEALKAGFQMHVPKPIEPLQLIQVVSQLKTMSDVTPPF